MAYKLDKGEKDRLAGYINDLKAASDELDTAMGEYRDAVRAAQDTLETKVAAYNEVLQEARGFVEDIASERRGQFDDKSEKWQEGDKGQAAGEWIDAFEQAELDGFEIVWPEELSDDMPTHASALEALPEEASE